LFVLIVIFGVFEYIRSPRRRERKPATAINLYAFFIVIVTIPNSISKMEGNQHTLIFQRFGYCRAVFMPDNLPVLE